MFWTTVGVILFASELYHAISHAFILFRVRLLPRKDLVKVKTYFLIDTATVALVNFVYLQKLYWLATLQMIQHLYHYFTWEKSYLTVKVVSWSSLDWQKFKCSDRWEWDVTMGTVFDLSVHLLNAYLISQTFVLPQLLFGVCLCFVGVYYVLFFLPFAWARPGSMAPWIQKRLASEFSQLSWHDKRLI